MAQKRRNENEADNMTGREKKKLKMSAARTIVTQAGSSQPIPINSALLKCINTLKETSCQKFRHGRYAQCHRHRQIRRSR